MIEADKIMLSCGCNMGYAFISYFCESNKYVYMKERRLIPFKMLNDDECIELITGLLYKRNGEFFYTEDLLVSFYDKNIKMYDKNELEFFCSDVEKAYEALNEIYFQNKILFIKKEKKQVRKEKIKSLVKKYIIKKQML